MRYLAVALLFIYAVLSASLVVRALLGLPFLLWLAMALPLAGFLFALVHAVANLGWRRASLFLVLTLAMSLVLESLGVAGGWLYGPYHYSDKFGPLFLGLVPYLIPLTWFMMLYPAYRIAARSMPTTWGKSARLVGVAAIGGVAMVAWDLVLDPLMAQRGHWVWEVGGVYFGVPLQNFLGWWLTAFVILALYQGAATARTRSPSTSPAQWRLAQASGDAFDRLALLGYAITGFGHVVDAWLAGLSGPASIGLLAMALCVFLGWRKKLGGRLRGV